MKAENFCFWLQGFFELQDARSITPEQAELIRTHLALVFKHDPAMAHPAPLPVVLPIVEVPIAPPKSADSLRERIDRADRRMADGILYC